MPRLSKIRSLLLMLTSVAVPSAWAAGDTIKIGVLSDMSGLYADLAGPGSVRSVEMAVQDAGGKIGNKKIEIVQGDHQNKADVASVIARRWFSSEGVDVIVNAGGSTPALAIVEVAKTYNKAVLVSGALSDRLSNDACSPNHVHYGLDSYAISKAMVSALVSQGQMSWFFIVVDNAFGNSLYNQSKRFLEAAGGQVVGVAKHSLGSQDFSVQLLEAQRSKAQIIALANAATDMTSAVSQANEFGLTKGGQKLAALTVFETDIHAMGLPKAQDTILTTAWYWDGDKESRTFGTRFYDKTKRMPTYYQAADYSATAQYLRAVAAVGSPDDGKKVIAAMKGKPINDFFAKGGSIREDGLLVHDIFLAQVKKPAESSRSWDYDKILQTIPGTTAFRPVAESSCALLKK